MKASQDMVSDRYKKINELNIAIDEMQKRYDEAISGSESKHLFERKLFDLKNEKANIEEEIKEILSFAKEQVENNPVTIPIKKESVLSGITEKDKKELEKQKITREAPKRTPIPSPSKPAIRDRPDERRLRKEDRPDKPRL